MAYSPNQLSQQDPRWKDEKLGFSNSKIGPYGCALASLTMLVNGFGANETPATLNQKLKGLGRGNGYIDDLVVWGGLPILFPEFSLRKITLCREDSKRAPLDEIDAALTRGQAVLVEIERSPASGLQNHWVVLYKNVAGDYLMNDPWNYPVDEGEIKLGQRYASGRAINRIITAVVWYEVETAPALDDGFYVQVLASAASGLRIRSQPTTDSVTLALAPANAYLRVLEDEADARTKIGVTGEWLHVRDLAGNEGYVAAWFLSAVENSAGNDDDDEDPGETPINDPGETPVNDPNDDDDNETNDEPTPVLTPGLKVYVSKTVGERGLRLRAQAGLGGALVTTMSAGAELTSLEDEATTRAKLAADDAWLHIEVGAIQAYTAAWLLTLDPNEEIEEETVEEPTNEPAPTNDDESDEDPAPVLTPGLKVYVMRSVGDNGLRMRAQPSLGGSLITMLSPAAELTSLEAADMTHTKVGTQGAWLHVKTGKEEGYVAAWLVTFDLEPEPVEEPVEEPQDTPEEEPTSADDPLPTTLTVTVFPSLGRNGLRMRAAPSLGGKLVSVLPGGTQLKLLGDPLFNAPKVGTYGQWLHVQDAQGREGYVAAWYVKLDEENLNIPAPEKLIVYVTPLARGGLRMRKGPSTGYGIAKTLKANSALTVLENEEEAITKIGATGEWLHVREEGGIEGYVAAWYIVR